MGGWVDGGAVACRVGGWVAGCKGELVQKLCSGWLSG